jgi:signal peptidase I
VETVVIAIAIFFAVYLFLLQPHQVRGESMEPTFQDAQYILTDKFSYRLHAPERGDVVVFKSPQNQSIDFIKRIVGLPGEKVKLVDGKVIVISDKYSAGLTLNETYTNGAPTRPGSQLKEGEEFVVPPNSYFVFGDNRNHSSDSREFGAVGRDLIIGRAWLRYWPLSNLSFIPQVQY